MPSRLTSASSEERGRTGYRQRGAERPKRRSPTLNGGQTYLARGVSRMGRGHLWRRRFGTVRTPRLELEPIVEGARLEDPIVPRSKPDIWHGAYEIGGRTILVPDYDDTIVGRCGEGVALEATLLVGAVQDETGDGVPVIHTYAGLQIAVTERFTSGGIISHSENSVSTCHHADARFRRRYDMLRC